MRFTGTQSFAPVIAFKYIYMRLPGSSFEAPSKCSFTTCGEGIYEKNGTSYFKMQFTEQAANKPDVILFYDVLNGMKIITGYHN